jgi:hypothetical protein
MKAIVQATYGTHDVLELTDIDKPQAKDDECSYAFTPPASIRASGIS